jgi:LacI family transcriptional regulator
MYVCESVRSHIARLADKGVPIVLLGQKHGPTPQVPFVGFDNRAVGRMATRYLLSLGHRSILCVTNTHNSNIVGMLRRDGYKDALTAAGVEVDQELIVEINPARSSYPLAAYDMLKAYLQTHKTFSAVFSHCDWASLGILKALREAGHGIPESISIVSEGEQPFAHYTDPPLTTVRLDSVKAGKTAARVLLDILDGKEAPSETLLEPELVERQSCAKAMR